MIRVRAKADAIVLIDEEAGGSMSNQSMDELALIWWRFSLVT